MDEDEAITNYRLRPPKNLRSIQPRRCCATCKHLIYNWQEAGSMDCERPDGPTYEAEGAGRDWTYIAVCDYWRA